MPAWQPIRFVGQCYEPLQDRLKVLMVALTQKVGANASETGDDIPCEERDSSDFELVIECAAFSVNFLNHGFVKMFEQLAISAPLAREERYDKSQSTKTFEKSAGQALRHLGASGRTLDPLVRHLVPPLIWETGVEAAVHEGNAGIPLCNRIR